MRDSYFALPAVGIRSHVYQRARQGTGRGKGFPRKWVREGIHAPASALDRATIGYGIGCLHLFTGEKAAARAAFERVVSADEWPAFGFIAAEAELARGMFRGGNQFVGSARTSAISTVSESERDKRKLGNTVNCLYKEAPAVAFF